MKPLRKISICQKLQMNLLMHKRRKHGGGMEDTHAPPNVILILHWNKGDIILLNSVSILF